MKTQATSSTVHIRRDGRGRAHAPVGCLAAASVILHSVLLGTRNEGFVLLGCVHFSRLHFKRNFKVYSPMVELFNVNNAIHMVALRNVNNATPTVELFQSSKR